MPNWPNLGLFKISFIFILTVHFDSKKNKVQYLSHFVPIWAILMSFLTSMVSSHVTQTIDERNSLTVITWHDVITWREFVVYVNHNLGCRYTRVYVFFLIFEDYIIIMWWFIFKFCYFRTGHCSGIVSSLWRIHVMKLLMSWKFFFSHQFRVLSRVNFKS